MRLSSKSGQSVMDCSGRSQRPAAAVNGQPHQDPTVRFSVFFGPISMLAKRRDGVLKDVCDSQRANSVASLMTPMQSAAGLSDTGGGAGHERRDVLPLAPAITR